MLKIEKSVDINVRVSILTYLPYEYGCIRRYKHTRRESKLWIIQKMMI